MRRAAQANWSRLPNHNPPRFYTAWVKSGKPKIEHMFSALPPKSTSPGDPWHR
jgi:hypothetical protein